MAGDRRTGTVRPATLADVDGIAAVHVASWRETYRGMMPDAVIDGIDEAGRAGQWQRALSADPPTCRVLVAESGPAIVGFVAGGPQRGAPAYRPNAPRPAAAAIEGYDAEVYAAYVLRAVQGHGFGRRLMAAVAERLRDGGATALCLWVARDNRPARRFYEHLGGFVLREKTSLSFGHELAEVAYGWPDIGRLAEAA